MFADLILLVFLICVVTCFEFVADGWCLTMFTALLFGLKPVLFCGLLFAWVCLGVGVWYC